MADFCHIGNNAVLHHCWDRGTSKTIFVVTWMLLQQLLLSVISSVFGMELLGSHCRKLEVVWLLEYVIRGGIEFSFDCYLA